MVRFTREVDVGGGQTVEIIQDSGPAHHGATVWDASLVLLSHCLKRSDFDSWKARRVLDLSAGTGVVAISLAKAGCTDVTASELFDDVIGLMEENIKANGVAVVSKKYKWAQEPAGFPAEKLPFHVILVSDAISYGTEHHPDLVKALLDLSDESTTILMAFEVRPLANGNEAAFIKLAKTVFDVFQIPNDQLDETYRSDDILVVRFMKR